MNEPEIKFTKRWNDCLEQYRESGRRIDGEKFQFVFHIFLGKKTNEIVREITVSLQKPVFIELSSWRSSHTDTTNLSRTRLQFRSSF